MPVAIARTIRFQVPEIFCSGCADGIRHLLKEAASHPKHLLHGLKQPIWIDPISKEVVLTIQTERQEPDAVFLEAIREIIRPISTLSSFPSLWPLIIKGGAGTVVGILFFILMIAGPALPLFAGILIAIGTVLLTAYLGWQIYRSAVVMLIKTRRFNMDSLFAISTLAALAISLAALFMPGLPCMFDAVFFIFGFRHLGLLLEASARRKILRGLTFDDRMPNRVMCVLEEGRVDAVLVCDLKPGQIILVPSNTFVPVDSVLLDETGSIYETHYNGNLNAISIQKGAEIRSGSRVNSVQPMMKLEVKSAYAASYHVKMDSMMRQLSQKQSSFEGTAERILRYFVPTVIAVALLAGILTSFFFPPALAIQCAVATLVSACPCVLGFILSFISNVTMSHGRKQGIFFKGGEAIEKAARVTAIVFDLNGTLTQGKKTVQRLCRMPAVQEKESQILAILASLEARVSDRHAVAAAIFEYAQSLTKESYLVTDFIAHARGVSGRIEGAQYVFGNETMMRENAIDLSVVMPIAEEVGQRLYLAKNNRVIAYLDLADPLRDGAAEVIATLSKKQSIYLCTGSDQATAWRYAKRLGIPLDDRHIAYNASAYDGPKSKVAFVEALQKSHNVAFVGDGGNDAPAMFVSLGIAMQSKTSDLVTEDTASILIQNENLQALPAMFDQSRRAVSSMKWSLGVSLSYNMIALLLASSLLLAIGFALNPGIGVLLMIVQTGLLLSMAYCFNKRAIKKTLVSSKTTTPRLMTVLHEKQPAAQRTTSHDHIPTPSDSSHVIPPPPALIPVYSADYVSACKRTY